MKNFLKILIFMFLTFLFVACFEQTKTTEKVDTGLPLPADTLRAVTMYGATSYFYFRDEYLGFDYEMVQNLADYLHLALKITVAHNEQEMAELVAENRVDIAAYNNIHTKELKREINFVFPQADSYQVLVQNKDSFCVSTTAELNGKTVTVKRNSVYNSRLISLNQEVGGDITIDFAPDSLSSEDLIEMVASGEIDFTLAYQNTALLYKTYYPNLDCSLHVGFNQRNGWLANKQSIEFQRIINEWEQLPETKKTQKHLHNKYWLKNYQLSNSTKATPRGAISPYDDFFKKYAKIVNWDWRLIVAVAFNESRFNEQEVSWAGAVGVMQLMPATAQRFGLEKDSFFIAEQNIETGIKYLKYLDGMYQYIINKDERVKFILASYNSGPAHVFDAIALTQKYGKNPSLWTDNVEYFLIKKNEPEFYQDSVVKYGQFRATETVNFVKKVQEKYEDYVKVKN